MRRLAALIIPLSAFLNNTPIVSMMMPMVIEWCRRRRVSPSRLLIPISYFAILGGTCTLIGTSTNLVVDGLMTTEHRRLTGDADKPSSDPDPQNQRMIDGVRPLGLFEVSSVGIAYALVGVTYLVIMGPRLLPERKELLEQLGDSRREYLLEMLVHL